MSDGKIYLGEILVSDPNYSGSGSGVGQIYLGDTLISDPAGKGPIQPTTS